MNWVSITTHIQKPTTSLHPHCYKRPQATILLCPLIHLHPSTLAPAQFIPYYIQSILLKHLSFHCLRLDSLMASHCNQNKIQSPECSGPHWPLWAYLCPVPSSHSLCPSYTDLGASKTYPAHSLMVQGLYTCCQFCLEIYLLIRWASAWDGSSQEGFLGPPTRTVSIATCRPFITLANFVCFIPFNKNWNNLFIDLFICLILPSPH